MGMSFSKERLKRCLGVSFLDEKMPNRAYAAAVPRKIDKPVPE